MRQWKSPSGRIQQRGLRLFAGKMNMEFYFADIVLESNEGFSCLDGFTGKKTASCRVCLDRYGKEPEEKGRLCSSHSELVIYRGSGGWIYESADPLVLARLGVSEDYKRLVAYMEPGNDGRRSEERLMHLVRTALECRFAFMGIVSLHAACVELEGKAVAFTAASGTGKSARASAWNKGLGSRWISGDRPAIRIEEDGAAACGVPWDGKEQIFVQSEYPLLAICEVRRAGFVQVRKLSAAQARRVLMQQCFVPMWDGEASLAVMGNVSRLIEKVPVLRLFCGPDERSAKQVYEILFHRQEEIKETLADMKAKDGFVMRNVVGEYIVMPVGEKIDTFGGTVVLNETAAFLWEKLQQPISREDLLQHLLSEFEIDQDKAEKDLDMILDKLRTYGMLEEV